MSSKSSDRDGKPWRFITSHTQVLLCIARNPEIRIRDLADLVGITERAAQRIIADLVEAGYLERSRVGRRNRYSVNGDHKMRHPLQETHDIGELLELLTPPEADGPLDGSELATRRAQKADATSKAQRRSEDEELAR
jgi:DNA-binding MarR family transcriptional regulator